MRKFGNFVRYTAEELSELRKQRPSRTDWAKVDAMTEEELQRSIDNDPDDFRGGIMVYPARDGFDGIILADLGGPKLIHCRIARNTFERLFGRSLTAMDCAHIAEGNVSFLADAYRRKPLLANVSADAEEPLSIDLTYDDIKNWEAASGSRLAAE